MKNNLPENLKTCCEIRNKTLTDFSQEVGIPRTTMHSIMKNEGNTTVDTAIRLAEKLNSHWMFWLWMNPEGRYFDDPTVLLTV